MSPRDPRSVVIYPLPFEHPAAVDDVAGSAPEAALKAIVLMPSGEFSPCGLQELLAMLSLLVCREQVVVLLDYLLLPS